MDKNSGILRYMTTLQSVPLFHGVSETDLPKMLDCLGAKLQTYEADNIIFLAGDPVAAVGIVCAGEVQVVREDIFGNRSIQAKLSAGDLFGETFACAQVDRLPLSVIAASACEILFIDYRRIITTCPATCSFHNRLIENMLGILAQKNLLLNRKIEVISARTTRGKLLAYFDAQAQTSGSRSFVIPFNRQELADFLSVDRSAMSAELGRMRDEGLIRFDRNRFDLLKK